MRIRMSFENKSLWQKFKEGNTKTERILIYIIAGIIAFIILGTIGVLLGRAIASNKERVPDPTPDQIESLYKDASQSMAAYTGLGKIRTSSKPETDNENDYGTLIVVSPWFSYPKDDTEFFEELSRKRVLITGLITNYFTSHTKSQLDQIPEEEIKATLLSQINAQLSLGKLGDLYFTDYIFIE